jgi:ABC-type Fe3+/spermidine/putrescine transport system ATPase subunit
VKDPLIEARQVKKFYKQEGANRIQVIAPTDLAIYADEILAVLGPSGSGKSTLLRMMTGLSTPSAGKVWWHGQPAAGPCESVSIVFQSFALFPWLTVLENVEAPLRARNMAPEVRRSRSMKILDTVGLDGFQTAYPKELSGGMKQRVGFARALVVEPEVLFMDEPREIRYEAKMRTKCARLHEAGLSPRGHEYDDDLVLGIPCKGAEANLDPRFEIGAGRGLTRDGAYLRHPGFAGARVASLVLAGL